MSFILTGSDDITNISDGRTLDFVCVFRAVFSRVFMGGKICALYFKICLTYFELCQTYFFLHF